MITMDESTPKIQATVIAATSEPSEFLLGKKPIEITWGTAESPLGFIFIASSSLGVFHLSFLESSETEALRYLINDFPYASLKRSDDSAAKISKHIFHEQIHPLPLHLIGTNFQQKVWRALLKIPSGVLTSYSSLAEKIDAKNSSRAVGNAVGKNRIAILIPCHRIIRSSGHIGGYRWGTSRKEAIISWEKTGTLPKD